MGGTPSQVWVGGYPIPSLGGYPISGLGWGGTPSQVWMVGGIPHLRFGWGYPILGLDGGGYLGYPRPGLDGGGTPSQVWMVGVPGIPPNQVWMVGGTWGTPPTHETEQHSEHLLHGGRCASCVHAGGLSRSQ